MTISLIGRWLILVGLFAAGMGGVLGFHAGWRRNVASWRWAQSLAYVFGGCMVAANFLMIQALVQHDFTVSYVAEVGSVDTPLYFTIVSLWASLNGSILLWAGVLGLYVIGLTWSHHGRDREYMPYTLGVLLVICSFFGLLVSGIANPFAATSPEQLAQMCVQFGCEGGIPINGPGPNPLLQNHWLMAFHPPTLYAGYVGMAVPFSMCAAALLAGRLEAGWLTPVRRWFLIPWAFLTVGIVLGGWWSYAVLGWGGYWAWDPVENASFMPWLVGAAFLHSAMLTQRRGDMKTWTLLLGMSAFLFTMFGTFLTRSGVFNSVHAFADGPVGPTFLVFIAISLLFTVILLSTREHLLVSDRLPRPRPPKSLEPDSGASTLSRVGLGIVLVLPPTIVINVMMWQHYSGWVQSVSDAGVPEQLAMVVASVPFFWVLLLLPAGQTRLLGRDFAILLQNVAFSVFTFVVFLGTVYPILADALRGRKISVGEPFFDLFTLPIGTAIVWMMGVGPMLPWGRSSVERTWRSLTGPLLFALLATGIVGALGVTKFFTLTSFFVCWFALAISAVEYLKPVMVRVRSRGESVPTALIRVFLRARRRFGGHIAHVGVVMAVLSIAVSKGFSTERDFIFNVGDSHEFAGYTITFVGSESRDEVFRTSQIASFAIKSGDRDLGALEPRLNNYPTRMEPLTSPAVRSTPVADLYISLMQADPKTQFASARIIYMPGVFWLWVAPLIIFLGVLVSIWPARVRAPASVTANDQVPEGSAA